MKIKVQTMNPYPKYKPTKIEWIGEIPEHWTETKLKFGGFLYSGLSGKSSIDFKQEESPLNKPFIPFTNIANNEKINPNNLEFVVINENENQNKVEKFDLFFMMSSENYDDVGKSTILVHDLKNVYLNSFCKGYRIIDSFLNASFLNYLLLSHPFRKRLMIEANGYTRINLKMDKIYDFRVFFPLFSEQQTIATYLDHKTNLIDTLISKKEKLIELLKEERTAIINEAVTKGLPAEARAKAGLDPKIKMKDSGIEWLGEIPEHWEVKKLKYFTEIVLGKMLNPNDKGGYFLKPYLRAQNINWLRIDTNDIKEMWFSDKELKQYNLVENDLLVSEGGEVGRTAIWKNEIKECFIQNSVHKVTVEMNNIPQYFLYLFYTYGKIDYFNSIVSRVSIAHLTREKLKEICCIVPPKNEQQIISNYVEIQTNEINNIILNNQKEIELLQEYRTVLISEVVTGKIDVRDYQIDKRNKEYQLKRSKINLL